MNISKIIAYFLALIFVFAIMAKAWNPSPYDNDDSEREQLQTNIRELFKAVMQERNELWNTNLKARKKSASRKVSSWSE